MLYKEVENFLDRRKCQEFMDKAEKTGNLDIDTEIGNDKYARHDFRDRNLCKILFERFERFERFLQHSENFIKTENIVDVANLFYVSKYFPGNSINWHVDGHRNFDGKISKYSFILYLNDNFDGGETSIKDENGSIVNIKPETGKVLLLDQDTLHCGKSVQNGIKYILRGDLMSRK